jgi:hypothetical protein
MKVSKDEFAQQIARDVAKLLLPRVRKMVREEIEYGVDKILKEQQNNPDWINEGSNDVDWEEEPRRRPSTNGKSASQIVAERRNAQKQRLAQYYDSNDPFMGMIMDADDPQEEKKIEEEIEYERAVTGPKKKLSEATIDDLVDPLNLDFGENIDAMERR